MSDAAKPDTVTVKALQAHTLHGLAYREGDVYELPAALLDTIVAQGKAVRTERVAAKAAAPAPPPVAKKP